MREINLAGMWRLALGQGRELPEAESFCDEMKLPSTTEIEKKGTFAPDAGEVLHLSRRYPIEGMAWYQKEISIPNGWKDKDVCLRLERTKFTRVYLDGRLCSSSFETIIPQKHLLGRMEPGIHTLTIGVDNALTSYENFPSGLMNGHQYTDHTQTNWNGILGEILLKPTGKAALGEIQVQKIKKENKIRIAVSAESTEDMQGNLIVRVFQETRAVHQPKGSKAASCYIQKWHLQKGSNKLEIILEPDWMIVCWDEFTPELYEIQILLMDEREEILDERTEKTGFTEIEKKEKRIYSNGNPVYLRGTVDCAIFPLTGAAPVEKERWLQVLRRIKDYGMNHYRFHSWCPPEGAFEAADELGVYLEVELSGFALALYQRGETEYDPVLEKYYYDQGAKILQTFGNHPSFLIFAVGNELVGNVKAYEELIRAFRPLRPDKLYTQGANNFLEDPVCSEEDDLWIIMRTSKTENIRASFAHSDQPLGHIQQPNPAAARNDYTKGLKLSKLPLIAHEIGQYQVYPNYHEIEKYTGALEPSALKIFQKELMKTGRADLADTFFEASGRLAVECYKEEIEAQLRTEGMTGFQMLGLQDFPGQGTALIGILDSFLEGKGLIKKEQWREFCSSCVILGCFDSYVWKSGDCMKLEILCTNFSALNREEELRIRLQKKSKIIQEYIPGICSAEKGKWNKLYCGEIPIPVVQTAEELELELSFGEIRNSYTIFLYPIGQVEEPGTVQITGCLDEAARKHLQNGGQVLLENRHTAGEIPGFFPTDFWCYPMFKTACETKHIAAAPGTMGLLIDSGHPALRDFPTEYFAQWQWQQIVTCSHSDVLDQEQDVDMIVQVIDNFQRCHTLGLIYEKKVGSGTLLVCNVNLKEHLDRPEFLCLYNSLLRYLKK